MKFMLCLLAILLSFTSRTMAAPDPKFYVFLCLGQSNMEGFPGLPEEEKDLSKFEKRFQMLAVVDFPQLHRTKGQWYEAIPPLCRPGCGLCPADYFGRTLVERLPKDIKVGVINVAVAGCRIELFEKDHYQAYLAESGTPDWLRNIARQYDGNPYQALVKAGKLAQKDGVIKGILLQQGESNVGDPRWPAKVKGVYDNLIKDLDLKAEQTPLLIGELTNGGGSEMIAGVLKLIPNSYVIPSKGCDTVPGNTIHFAPTGYRELGKRFGIKMCDYLNQHRE